MKIRYSVTIKDPNAHLFEVQLQLKTQILNEQLLRLPTWIPGSYMIRDFAKNIVEIKAYQNNETIELIQIDKSTWKLPNKESNSEQEINIIYTVYAWDLSVRTAHLDQTHGFFNGTSLFLEVVGYADQRCQLEILKPNQDICSTWRLATSMKKQDIDSVGFGFYQADDYLDLIDHPVELGSFKKLSFNAHGVIHDVVITGLFETDEQRLVNDLKIICEHHINFFGQPAPVDYYLFLIMVVGEGYGGLEHRASTSLLVNRGDLPQKGQTKISSDYRKFLGLCSHEYFHTWNVKRLTPNVFVNPDLSQEVYTPQLWAFEGITSYYDDLALLRCGLIDQTSYFELLAQTITRVNKTQGRLIQTVSESSFNAWTKFYKQDENAVNAIISYYAKGTLIALCLDLFMRKKSEQKYNLDTVMQALWQDYLNGYKGFSDDTIQNKVEVILGESCSEWFDKVLNSVEELPLNLLLQNEGVEIATYAAESQSDMGGKVIENPTEVDFGAFLQQKEGALKVIRVNHASAAQCAGLSAGDEIIAVNGLKQNLNQFEALLKLKQADNILLVHVFRRDELMQFEVKLNKAIKNIVVLSKPESNDSVSAQSSWPI